MAVLVADDIVGPGLELKQTLSDLAVLYKGGKLSAEQYSDALDKVHLQMAELDKTAGGGVTAGLLKVKAEFSDLGNLAERAIVDGFSKAEDALVSFAQTGKLSVKDMVSSIVSDLIRLQIRQSITGPLFSAISGGAAGAGSGLLGSLFSAAGGAAKSLFSGFFADGGFIPPGQWGVAGEAGAEAIFGGRTGATVVPAGAARGGDTYNVDLRGASVEAVARLEQFVRSVNGSIERRAVHAVADAQQRGRM